MPTVSLDQLQNAMEWTSSDFLENEAYSDEQAAKALGEWREMEGLSLGS